MSSAQPLPPKKEVALALLERSSVHVHLDPRAAGVLVPPVFKTQPQLVLQVGLNMPVPIPDLRLDEEGFSCTLSFNRSPFHCVVPWSSVYAMVGDDGRGMVWPDDVPAEVARQAQTRPSAVPDPPAETTPSLRGAAPGKKAAKKSQVDEALADDAKSKKPRKKPRVVPNPRDENRARLVAVPAPAVSDPRPPTRSSRDADGAARTPGARAGAPKTKRKLPPYLRLVK